MSLIKVFILLSFLSATSFGAPVKWQARIPAVGQSPELWIKTIESMRAKDLHFGAMAAAHHMIALLPDITSKEEAYKTVIAVIDEGYPVVVRDIFIPGDIEPVLGATADSYQFVNSYYLYKGIISKEKNNDHWANFFFNKVDRENFPKYLLYKAIESYESGNLLDAEQYLHQALSKKLNEQPRALAVKLMRTLARVYFDEGEYTKSLDIYTSFLLKLNPVVPSDWLEAAWNEFHLKHYPESLGMLYNLESKAGSSQFNLEKYNIRALIYRATCSISNMEELKSNFDSIFKPVLDGIKKGESLTKFPVLRTLEIPENAEYNQTDRLRLGLSEESVHISELPASEMALANYIYSSELKVVHRRLRELTNDALNRAGSQILMISEQMRFLLFDIERSRYNPDLIFKSVSSESPEKKVSSKDDKSFEIRWLQYGDYWLDERNKIKGLITNQCSE